MRAWCCLVPLFLVLSACQMRKETPADHAVHKGESAVLMLANQEHAYLAVAHFDTHALAQAVEGKDRVKVQALLDAGKALAIDNRTRVNVIGESYNEREIQVLDGPMQGRKGWVPFEWLRPAV